ncbi:MAG TPA: hypothetical protein ENI65_05265 [Gammaproteobacteria bacterium]|nr:hypothetical protein [Gammaproteobacteria bacterium]
MTSISNEASRITRHRHCDVLVYVDIQAGIKRNQASRAIQYCMALLVFLFPVSEAAEKQILSEYSALASKSLLLDITRVANSVIAVGERGHVIKSDDCGKIWKQIIIPDRVTLNGIYFLDDKHGWIVGHDSTILKTVDGGEHWKLVYHDIAAEQPLFDILFVSASKGFAIGAYGAYLETRDGGSSWSKKSVFGEDDFHLYSISRVGEDKLIITGESGAIYVSSSNGEKWWRVKSPYEGTLFGNMVLSDGRVLIFGMRGNLYSSDDLGEKWQRLKSGVDATLDAGIELDDKTVLLTGSAGTVLESVDGGASYNIIQQKLRSHRAALVQCTDGRVLSAGEKGIQQISR